MARPRSPLLLVLTLVAGASIPGCFDTGIPGVGGTSESPPASKAARPDTAAVRAQLKDAEAHQYFIVINGAIATEKDLKKIDPVNVTSIKILRGDDAVQQYGSDAKKGAVVVVTSEPAKKDTTAGNKHDTTSTGRKAG